jgi:hypothetical protein
VARRVPLARRNLLADWRRLSAGVLGVGLALMLVFLLDAMRRALAAPVIIAGGLAVTGVAGARLPIEGRAPSPPPNHMSVVS